MVYTQKDSHLNSTLKPLGFLNFKLNHLIAKQNMQKDNNWSTVLHSWRGYTFRGIRATPYGYCLQKLGMLIDQPFLLLSEIKVALWSNFHRKKCIVGIVEI